MVIMLSMMVILLSMSVANYFVKVALEIILVLVVDDDFVVDIFGQFIMVCFL